MSVEQAYDKMMILHEKFKEYVQKKNPHLYERWKAGGFMVDDGFISMYPDLKQVLQELGKDV